MRWGINHSNMWAPHRSRTFGSTIETHSRLRSVPMVSHLQGCVFHSIALLSIVRFPQILTVFLVERRKGQEMLTRFNVKRNNYRPRIPCYAGHDNVAQTWHSSYDYISGTKNCRHSNPFYYQHSFFVSRLSQNFSQFDLCAVQQTSHGESSIGDGSGN